MSKPINQHLSATYVKTLLHYSPETGVFRWSNLREATHAQNKQNQRPNKNNTAGIKGVHKRKDCNHWAAMINVKGKTKYLGLYKTAEEAKKAYIAAAKKFYGAFAYTL